jgi:hypothetical protein
MKGVCGTWKLSNGRTGRMKCSDSVIDAESWVLAEDYKVTYLKYKIVRKDWITRGGAVEDWPFGSPMVDRGEGVKEGA